MCVGWKTRIRIEKNMDLKGLDQMAKTLENIFKRITNCNKYKRD